MYQILKHFHLLTLIISVSLFCIRYGLMVSDSPYRNHLFFKKVPHINDTLLLISGIGLVMITGFIPLSPAAPWLTNKLLCVVIYIILGFFALHWGKNKLLRHFAFFGALGWFAIVVKVATTKIPFF